MFKSAESARSKKLPSLLLALGLGATSLGLAGCGNFAFSKNTEAPGDTREDPIDDDLLVITREDCLEEYGNPNPFLGDAIVADPATGEFQQIDGVQIIDKGVVPLSLFGNYALGLYDRFCGTPFAYGQVDDLEANQDFRTSKL